MNVGGKIDGNSIEERRIWMFEIGQKKWNGTIQLENHYLILFYSMNWNVFCLKYKGFYVVESENPMERKGKYYYKFLEENWVLKWIFRIENSKVYRYVY